MIYLNCVKISFLSTLHEKGCSTRCARSTATIMTSSLGWVFRFCKGVDRVQGVFGTVRRFGFCRCGSGTVRFLHGSVPTVPVSRFTDRFQLSQIHHDRWCRNTRVTVTTCAVSASLQPFIESHPGCRYPKDRQAGAGRKLAGSSQCQRVRQFWVFLSPAQVTEDQQTLQAL